ncbi:hypothetical protein LZC95_05355 [Pendulispora brunnea]|uniref:Lipoprotein n=1 Tax=Pendulispora brunnea TaxID=2905690 RepID=A0ABZ2KFI6_9BACT
MKSLVMVSILIGSMCGCNNEVIAPDRKSDLTGSDLCASINLRASTCDEKSSESLSNCDRTADFMECAYEPRFALDYSDCRGTKECSANVDHAACMAAVGRANNEKETAACMAMAQACRGQWNIDVCTYPRFQPIYRKRMEDCMALPSCTEQTTCIDSVVADINATCRQP